MCVVFSGATLAVAGTVVSVKDCQSGFSTVVLPQIGTFVAAVDFRYLPECTFSDMLIYCCFMRHVLIIQYLNDFLVLYEWFFVVFLKLNGEYQEKMTFFYAVSICPKSELLLQLICPKSELLW